MSQTRRITRRTVLRGLGTAVALPWLESMGRAADVASAASGAATASGAGPLRMAFLYVPNGVHMPCWRPQEDGPISALPPTLEALAPMKDDLIVFSGLAQRTGFAMGDGPGDHARSLATFLTGVHPRKTDGADIRVGISADQVAAQKVGRLTRFPSLELGIDRGGQSGSCDSGYSCAYSSNISWRTETTPMPKEVNPRLVFDRLFASRSKDESAAARAKRELYNKSVLDFVAEDADSLKRRLGRTDQRKVEEYLTSVREIEKRIDAVGGASEAADLPGFARPQGVPQDNREHIKLMLDLMVLAFQGDVTRIGTFMFANEGSTKSYPFIGVPEGHHDLSHHGGNPHKHEQLIKINRYHISHLAYFLGRLKEIQEGDRTLLDNAMIVYGSGLSDGNRHNHNDLPILMAGRGGGTIRGGRHIKLDQETPLNNLFLAMLDRMGVPVDSLGDSTGRLDIS
jgi:hypothetical protein